MSPRKLHVDKSTAGKRTKSKAKPKPMPVAKKSYEPFSDKTAPQWLRAALKNVDARATALPPAWLKLSALPPIVIGTHRLNDEQVHAVLAALQYSDLSDE